MLKFFKKKYRTLNLIQVSKSRILENWKHYQNLLPGKAICPVLKANAYGHGLELIGRIFEEERKSDNGPPLLVVDSLYEAYRLKKARVKVPILILGYTFPENLKKKKNYHFTASDPQTLQKLIELELPFHIEMDTGMTRMGLSLKELEDCIPKIKKHSFLFKGLFTHLADADNSQNAYTEKQVKLFKEAYTLVTKNKLQPEWVHVGNSAGALKADLAWINMVRLGIGLYGTNAYLKNDKLHDRHSTLKEALRLRSTIIATRRVKKGTKVSYNCTYEIKSDTILATLPFGYYEGLPRTLSNTGLVSVKGTLCPIIGRVCMNHIMIDLSPLIKKGLQAKIGEAAWIYNENGEQPSFKVQAPLAGTIPYELKTNLSESIRRVLID